MKSEEIATRMENGSTIYLNREDASKEIPWEKHPKFDGVCLKHLIKGADTEGKLSCHMVRIDPGAVLDEHIHDVQWELHEVISGDGEFLLNTKKNTYYSGRMALIPKGMNHKVIAGKNGLILLAKFFPALI